MCQTKDYPQQKIKTKCPVSQHLSCFIQISGMTTNNTIRIFNMAKIAYFGTKNADFRQNR